MIESNKEKGAGWFERFLPRSQSRAVFLFCVLCYSWTVTELVARLIHLAGFWPVVVDPNGNVARYVRPGIDEGRLDVLIFATFVESFIMIGSIELLRRLRFGFAVQIIVSVSLMFLVHAQGFLFWAFLVTPAFLIDAGSYIYWRRVSFWAGAQMIIALHALYNCFGAITILADRLGR